MDDQGKENQNMVNQEIKQGGQAVGPGDSSDYLKRFQIGGIPEGYSQTVAAGQGAAEKLQQQREQVRASSEDLHPFQIGETVPLPTSQTEIPDIRMQVGIPGFLDDEQKSAFQKFAEFQQQLAYRRTEYSEWNEQLRPQDVDHFTQELVGTWLDQWYRLGRYPNEYYVYSAEVSASGRIEQLLDSIPNGNHQATEQEKLAGLVEGKFFRQVDEDFLTTEGLEKGAVTRPNGKVEEVWMVNGNEVGLFKQVDLSGLTGKAAVGSSQLFIGTEVSVEEAEKNRENLANTLRVRLSEIESFSNILEKVQEQDFFAGDDEGYLVTEFTRVGKAVARSKFYGEILNLPPTREAFPGFGERVVAAHEAWRDIMEGRAVVDFEYNDPTTQDPNRKSTARKILPNPFAYAKNQGLIDLCTKYVQQRVLEDKPLEVRGQEIPKSIEYANKKDARNAALAALILVNHWDEDAEAAFDVLRNQRGEVDDVTFEVSFKDSSKLIWPKQRREKEFMGWTMTKEGRRRTHPREAGSPVTLKFLPKLSSHFLEVTSVGVLVTNKRTGEKKVLDITIDQLIGGAKDINGDRIVIEDGGVKRSRVVRAKDSSRKSESDVWEYEMKSLSDRVIWDSIQIVLTDNNQNPTNAVSTEKIDIKPIDTKRKSINEIFSMAEQTKLALGTNTNAYEIPKSLLEMYAYKAIYSQFIRTDHLQQYKEFTDPDSGAFKKLNKQITLGLYPLSKQYQLSEDTTEKLEEFIRIGLLAGLITAITRRDDRKSKIGRKIENRPQMDENRAYHHEATTKLLLDSAFASQFIRSTEDTNKPLDWASEDDKRLFESIISRRFESPISPFNYGYFTKSQIEELKNLY